MDFLAVSTALSAYSLCPIHKERFQKLSQLHTTELINLCLQCKGFNCEYKYVEIKIMFDSIINAELSLLV